MLKGHLRAKEIRPTGLLTLPGEDWSPPGKRPRNSYMTNLDGLCQGRPEGEKYPKTTRTGKATQKQTKRKCLVRASSSAQPTEEKKSIPYGKRTRVASTIVPDSSHCGGHATRLKRRMRPMHLI